MTMSIEVRATLLTPESLADVLTKGLFSSAIKISVGRRKVANVRGGLERESPDLPVGSACLS